jgi:phosphatidylserine decarboxylase
MDKFSWTDSPRSVAFPVARPGVPIIFAAAFVTAVLALLGLTAITLVSLGVTLFICYFFRDPDRVIPRKEGAVVSPADGRVISVLKTVNERFFDGPCLKISIFMSVFNVHVNRIPCKGEVTKVLYHPGKFFTANLDKASEQNEHNAVFLKTEESVQMSLVQIAGLIARRIICKLQVGDQMNRGERFGMICFGSRVDVYLPQTVEPAVTVGDKVQAGTSILGVLK